LRAFDGLLVCVDVDVPTVIEVSFQKRTPMGSSTGIYYTFIQQLRKRKFC
jgi:hypothetical protein